MIRGKDAGNVSAQAGVPVSSTVGKFAGYNHASTYLMDEHDAAMVAGFPQPPASG